MTLTWDHGSAVELMGSFRCASVLKLKLEPDMILDLGTPSELTLATEVGTKFVSGLENAAVSEEIFLFFSRNSM